MRKYLLLVVLSLIVTVSIGQEREEQPARQSPLVRDKPSIKDRLFFGGNVGLSFGSLTYINVAPTIGYKITERFGMGLGPTYTYYNDRRFVNYRYETHIYGGRTFAQYQALESVLLYSEFEVVNIEVPDLLFTKLIRTNVSSLFVGGGYTQRMGSNSAVTLMILYNVLESDYKIYENPILRLGFNFGM
ncbi:MAG: hypothetical protein IPK10_06175 [Bacteroidetes bacterium]|nr:hypothetical protein [Bacteroidota bacterium]